MRQKLFHGAVFTFGATFYKYNLGTTYRTRFQTISTSWERLIENFAYKYFWGSFWGKNVLKVLFELAFRKI